jgi:predicted nucleotidyltransferase
LPARGAARYDRRVPIPLAVQHRIEVAVSRHPEVCAAWVFGSVARGAAGAESDLDLAVLLARGVDLEGARAGLATLSLELEACSPSGRVDLLVLGAQGPVLVHRVLTEGVLVRDADPERRIDFEGDATVAYLDWKPTHDIAMRTALEGLQRRFARMGGE